MGQQLYYYINLYKKSSLTIKNSKYFYFFKVVDIYSYTLGEYFKKKYKFTVENDNIIKTKK